MSSQEYDHNREINSKNKNEINKLLDESQSKKNETKTFLLVRNFFKKRSSSVNEIGIGTRSNDLESQSKSSSSQERLRWNNYGEYFLSIIGFVIDLGFNYTIVLII
jgi:hypothetical protein